MMGLSCNTRSSYKSETRTSTEAEGEMADIIGRIGPATEITEVRSLDGPSTTYNLSDTSGRVHGRIIWLSDEVNEDFLREVAHLCAIAFKRRESRKA